MEERPLGGLSLPPLHPLGSVCVVEPMLAVPQLPAHPCQAGRAARGRPGNSPSRAGRDPKHTQGPLGAWKEHKYTPTPDLETGPFQLPPCFSPIAEIQRDVFSTCSPSRAVRTRFHPTVNNPSLPQAQPSRGGHSRAPAQLGGPQLLTLRARRAQRGRGDAPTASALSTAPFPNCLWQPPVVPGSPKPSLPVGTSLVMLWKEKPNVWPGPG